MGQVMARYGMGQASPKHLYVYAGLFATHSEHEASMSLLGTSAGGLTEIRKVKPGVRSSRIFDIDHVITPLSPQPPVPRTSFSKQRRQCSRLSKFIVRGEASDKKNAKLDFGFALAHNGRSQLPRRAQRELHAFLLPSFLKTP